MSCSLAAAILWQGLDQWLQLDTAADIFAIGLQAAARVQGE